MQAKDVINKLNLGTAKQVLNAEPQSPMTTLMLGLMQEVIDRLGDSIDKWDARASNRLKQSMVTVNQSKQGTISIAISANFLEISTPVTEYFLAKYPAS